PGVRLGRRDPDRGGKRQTDLEVPPVRQHGPGQDECGPPDLRLHRDPVLEPGPDPGDPGSGAASVNALGGTVPPGYARAVLLRGTALAMPLPARSRSGRISPERCCLSGEGMRPAVRTYFA